MKVKWVIHRSRGKIRTKDHGFAVSRGYATDSDAKTHWSCSYRTLRSIERSSWPGPAERILPCR